MSNKSVPVLAALALLVLGSTACDRHDEEPVDDAATEEAEAVAVALGSEASSELASTLVTRLRAAMEADGAAGAVTFCSEQGLALTAAVSQRTGVEIRRTSLRLRNPANVPDALERAALAYFENHVASGDPLPGRLIQREPDGDYRYYQPLLVQPFCLQCHGGPSDLGEGVASALADKYPEDRATGYAAGDFRGVIRVSLPKVVVEAGTPAGPR